MNALIPAFVAVLLAEIGGPVAGFGRERRKVAGLAMFLLVAVAAIGGWSVAELLTAPARTLLVGLALLFAGFAQFGQRMARTRARTLFASTMTLYRSPAPLLAFALSAWMSAPLTACLGALAGLVMATVCGSLAFPRAVRIGAGITLCAAGLFAALNGLRLV